MNAHRQAIIAIALSLFLPSVGYGERNPCLENSGSLECLAHRNPYNLASDCLRDTESRSCVCAQSCGVSTLTTHSEALNHLGYASCYKTGVISPFSGCLGLTKRPTSLLDAWAHAGETLIR